MKDSLSYRGSSLWNFVNYNDKEAAASPNFNDLKKRVSAEDYFKDFKFDSTSIYHTLKTTGFCVLLIIVFTIPPIF